MDKAALLRAFKVMVNEAGRTAMSEKCKLAAAPLNTLKPMEIREAHILTQQLSQQVCYEGRVVHANISVAAKAGPRLVLCLVESENEDGGSAYLHIFNALKSSSKPEEAATMFPKDAKIAIKEPLCYCSIMHVSSPASLDFLGLAKNVRRKSVEDLKKEGDRLLLKGNYVLAELHYTELINLFMARDKSTYGETEYDVFSNRAEARLKLGRYEEAIADADFALRIGMKQNISGSVYQLKSLCTKGKGLTALHEHELAKGCFESASAVTSSPPPPELLADLSKSETYLRQSKRGEYEISHHLITDSKLRFVAEYPEEYADFFGPLELQMTPDGRGRGVYLTKDVALGELLLVCNPTAASPTTAIEEADEDLYVDLVKACTNSEKRLKQIYAMADAAEMKNVQDITPFKCNTGKVLVKSSSRVVDIDRIRRVRDRVGFTSQSGGVYCPGLWASVGLINHSCLPNASKLIVENVVFVRAAKNIKAGEEVVLSYMENALAPLSGGREKAIERNNFECRCARCQFERENKNILRNIPYKDEGSLSFNVNDNVMDLVKDIERRIKTFPDKEKNWIRAGFVDAYSVACMMKTPGVPSTAEFVRVLHDTAPGSKHTLSKIAIICNLGGRHPEAMTVLYEAIKGIYGEQKQEVVDALVSKYRIPSLAR